VAEVPAIHADQIERYGGAQGVRDQESLESALYRLQTGYYAGLIEEAAALWEEPFTESSPY
jgi:death on curing protein